MRRIWILLACLLCVGVATAQDTVLIASKPTLVTKQDVYGQSTLYANGTLNNKSADKAFSGIELEATAIDADGKEVGEGLGYLANACGASLPPDFVLTPAANQFYVIPIELYDADAKVDHVTITVDSTPADAPSATETPLGMGVKQIDKHEIAQVEWIDEQHLRYGEGCHRDLFTNWTWRTYDLRTASVNLTPHPKADLITEALRRQLGLIDPLYFQNSQLTFDPNGKRLVYQNELNTVLSAESDGSFKRRMLDKLSDRTLQGIYWLSKGIFLAYYYGAFGDLVTYFTADADNRILSETPANSTPSLITPGASPDGQDVIIGLEMDGKTGYYDKRAAYETTTLLFESPLPGNNWPGPVYEKDSDDVSFIYMAVPQDEGAKLVCYNVQTKDTHDLTTLPLQLTSDERASWWLSPDKNTIALAAEGIHGGLWLIDLNATKACD
ncbi:MAG: hypothetical protein H0X30_20720 [Anaerolineae bacterium]|nr:hypothetical protein [Anaerolineae bacterium]